MSKERPTSKLAPKEELDVLLQEFSNMKAYADAIRQQLELASNIIADMLLSKASLMEIKSRSGNGETLIHIGGGNYIRAQLQNVDSVIVGIGSGVSVEKSLDDAISNIDSRIKLGQEQATTLQNNFTQISARLGQLQGRIDQLYAQLEAAGQA
ncbi:MAG: prefoldin subunit alpha [Candidatus Methanomethylicus sp.]|nr:prefoldin subunit alpha [Candidatus Methanomethylicus sp.]